MSNYRRAIAVTLAAAAVAVTASVPADAAGPGSVTAREGRRVVAAADAQQCLTLREVRRIVHGTGLKAAGDTIGVYQTWKGKGRVAFLDVNFESGCADGVWLDYDNGQQLAWIDYASPTYR